MRCCQASASCTVHTVPRTHPRQGQPPSQDIRAWAQPSGRRTERKTRFLVLVLSACESFPQE